MINSIKSLAKLDAIASSAKITRFNSLLPMKIDVLDELMGGKYKLLVGTKLLETKSNLKLDVGESYWGVMKEDVKTKNLSLSNLLKQPKLLKHLKHIPKFSTEKLAQILTKENPKLELKTTLLDHLSKSNSKQEFMTTTSMVNALEQNVFTFVMTQNGKEAIFQFKKRNPKKKSLEKQENTKIDFYAAFENLGPVEGVVEVKDDVKSLSLYLYYENSVKFLQSELNNLEFIAKIYKKNKSIEPLFYVSPNLLDVRG